MTKYEDLSPGDKIHTFFEEGIYGEYDGIRQPDLLGACERLVEVVKSLKEDDRIYIRFDAGYNNISVESRVETVEDRLALSRKILEAAKKEKERVEAKELKELNRLKAKYEKH